MRGSRRSAPVREERAQLQKQYDNTTSMNAAMKEGTSPKALTAAGYSELDPVAANDTAEHKALNRRIEIVLQPNLADVPPLDAVK
ncbi:MAG TPA: hypothetical protein VK427_16635 [Kofleriaceae bacterium]|nr:hypothetical protein [Kofleriaceae bacterium]